MAIFCVGDIHGKFDELAQLLSGLPVSAHVLCLGDIGLGFEDSNDPSCLAEVDAVAESRGQHVWMLRGNHDNPAIWNFERYRWNEQLRNIRIPADIHRMKIDNVHVIMVGGGTSLDRSHPDRLDGHNWWPDESVTHSAPEAVARLVDAYGRADILLTHAGPLEAKPGLERDRDSFDYYAQVDPELEQDVIKERRLLSEVVTASQSRTVAFGHYHVPTLSEFGPIRYRCCGELEAWEYVKRATLPPLPPSLATGH